MRRHAMLKPGGIDDYRLCTSFKNIFKIFYFGPKSTPRQPLSIFLKKWYPEEVQGSSPNQKS